MDSSHSVLLLEDEPVSAEFLSAALAPLGLDICIAGSLAQARARLQQRGFSLLLLDLGLPDGSGSELLDELRASPQSPSQASPALALTAELDEARRAALRLKGFADALSKPLSAKALRDAVSRMLANSAPPLGTEPEETLGTSEVWDDAAALTACGGSIEVLNSLRGLFLKELPEQAAKIRDALQTGQVCTALDELHRLLAGCGFCGACDLAGAARRLMQRMRESGEPEEAVAGFEAAVARVLATRQHD